LRHVLGLRFLAEAAFVVLVAVLVWYAGASDAGIFSSIAAAWLLVALAEWTLSRRRRKASRRVAQPAPALPPLPQNPLPTPAARSVPRMWNLWDLERQARETAGADTARDEERSFLLMYLREFAAADGVLPAEFDPLVRETFADLAETVRP
jgi:hypothetical protein